MSMTSQVMIDALSNEEDWTVNHYHAIHNPSKMSFWIANGAFFFDCEQYPNFGYLQRHRLWRHYKKMCQRKLNKLMIVAK